MQILGAILLFLLGFGAGQALHFLWPGTAMAEQAPVAGEDAKAGIQLENLLRYSGSGKGQEKLNG